ncbi:MAG: hypothetical protein JWO03_2716 [Bacteroidetes bacterium]|nr:hypothetical protein [Bacteroidota bacterium]
MAEDVNILNDWGEAYKAAPCAKKITFFTSFEEAEEHGLHEMAKHSHEERLKNLEILRKRTHGHMLLPDGSWPPLKRIITIEYASYL